MESEVGEEVEGWDGGDEGWIAEREKERHGGIVGTQRRES